MITFFATSLLTGLTAIATPFAAAFATRQWIHRMLTFPVLLITGYVAFKVFIKFFDWLGKTRLADYINHDLMATRLTDKILERCIKNDDLEPFKRIAHVCKKISLINLFQLSYTQYSSFLEDVLPRNKVPGQANSLWIGPQAEKMMDDLLKNDPKGDIYSSFTYFHLKNEHWLLWIDQPDYEPANQKRKQLLDTYKGVFSKNVQNNLYPNTAEGRMQFFKDDLKPKFPEDVHASNKISKDLLLELINIVDDNCQEFELPADASICLNVIDKLKAKGFTQDSNCAWKFKK